MAKRWLGTRNVCDICKKDVKNVAFVDGRTIYGPWALMCEQCHEDYGVGLGVGRGQKYDKDNVKISG